MEKFKVIALSVGGQGRKKVYDSGDIVDQSNFEVSVAQLVAAGFIKPLTKEEFKLYADKTEIPGETQPELTGEKPKEIPTWMIDVAERLEIKVEKKDTFQSLEKKINEAGAGFTKIVDELKEKKAAVQQELDDLNVQKTSLQIEVDTLEAKKLEGSTSAADTDASGSDSETEEEKLNAQASVDNKEFDKLSRNQMISELKKRGVEFAMTDSRETLLGKLKESAAQ